jgi:hypothetical protein
MKIIDAHLHIYDEDGYTEKLLKVMDSCGIEKSCISGLGKRFGFVDNSGIEKVVKSYPDRFIGAVYVRPGFDKADTIERGYDSGFKMVKVTLPAKGYESEEYFPLWQKAAELKMPVLFHTGIVNCKSNKGDKISSWNMHPLRIEPVSNEFADLKIIIAHLGVSSNMDAAELARMRSNVYVDITGAPGGWRVRLDKEGLDKYLWWDGAFDKLIFGTDVHCEDIEEVLERDKKRFNELNIDPDTQENIFSGNIEKLLGISK